MIDAHLAIEAPEEVIQSARDSLNEMEQEFIMLRFKYSSPVGKYQNEVRDIPGVGVLTVNCTRDIMFMNNVQHEMKLLRNLLSKENSYITIKRLKVFRQRFNGMVHNNQNASRSRSAAMWNRKSAKFIAGQFLSEIVNKHISRDVVSTTY